MAHHLSMAAAGDRSGPPIEGLKAAVDKMAAWIGQADGEMLGDALIQIREAGIDPLVRIHHRSSKEAP